MAPSAPASLQHVAGAAACQALCALGQQALRRGSYAEAIELLSQAVVCDEQQLEGGAQRSEGASAYALLGAAHHALCQWGEAASALEAALRLDPHDTAASKALQGVRKRIQVERAARQAQAATERHALVLKLRAARRADQQLAMLNQFKQSMVGPDWELEDLEWRPTFLPSMKLAPLKPESLLPTSTVGMLRGYLNALADLAHPKQVLDILADEERLLAYQEGITAALAGQPDAHVLVLGAGSGVLGLLAARSGAQHVAAVERSPMLFRMAHQAVESNLERLPAGVLEVLPCKLERIGVEGEQAPAEQQPTEQSGRHATAPPVLLPRRAGVLVTDLLDHSVLGMGLLPAVDHAARCLLAPGAQVIPQCVHVFAVLIDAHVGPVSGFDLSPMNTYWWYPHHEAVQLSNMHHRRLSAPFLVRTLDLQTRVAAAQRKVPADEATASAAASQHGWELDIHLAVPVTADGKWNAVAFWFGVCTGASTGVNSFAAPSSAGVDWPVASSWQQAVQFMDDTPVTKGSIVDLRVRQDCGQFVFTTHPPQCRPRHALVPRWHFDMVLDQQRNDAYDAAICRAVQRVRAAGCTDLLALDIGAGSGLLSMMAARAGADSVYAAEISAHMCDVAEETTIMNGFLGKVTVLDKDARRLDVARKPDGTAPELPRRANLLVYEVFDSGLIGEGILHLLAAVQHKLLASDAIMVPSSATVYCQLIQMRVGDVMGLDMQQANRWRWRPDYEGVDLPKCRPLWRPLAKPIRVFEFSFADAQRNLQPAEVVLRPEFTVRGVVNAVATWFELALDEQTTLSTSPYADKGPTWQQAVQWVEELEVGPGSEVELVAKHDTYSIAYNMHKPSSAPASGRAGVPLRDPAWQAAHDHLQGFNAQLVKACVQNPLEYRATALAALQLAARPHDTGVDAAQAAAFAAKMMG